MSKSEITKQLEDSIRRATTKMGTFGCLEVTVNYNNRDERIDYLTYETKGIWRCYEIKSSLSDFNSNAAHTFIGHFNYYVMTNELYEQAKDKIPSHIGVYTYGYCKKKPKKQELQLEHEYLMYCLMRSIYSRWEKLSKSTDDDLINRYNRRISSLEREKHNISSKYYKLQNAVIDKYGFDEYNKMRNESK